MTWTVTSNQKKAFLTAWTHMSEKCMLLQWNQWNKSGVRCKCVTSRVLAQLFSPVLQPWIQHFHFTSFWSQIQLNLTIYLSHRHICRQIATTDSNVQYPRKTTNCQRTGIPAGIPLPTWLWPPLKDLPLLPLAFHSWQTITACSSLAWREQSMEWNGNSFSHSLPDVVEPTAGALSN